MGTASGMIAQMRKWIGTTEHPAGSNDNEIVERYNKEIKRIGRGPWCDMTVSIAAKDSGNAGVVGQEAYTPDHAEWFYEQGRWHTGAAGIAPGDVVFFDWGGSHDRAKIDHVGVVERVQNGEIDTIEGNKGDACVRVVRDGTYIAGYGRPAYDKPALKAPAGDPVLKKGIVGARVIMLQRCLNKVQKAGLGVDGDYGDLTKAAVKAFQRAHKDPKGRVLLKDGEYGDNTAASLAAELKKAS